MSASDSDVEAAATNRPQTIFGAVINPVWLEEIFSCTPQVDGHVGQPYSLSFAGLANRDARQHLFYSNLTHYCESLNSLRTAQEKNANNTQELEATKDMYRDRISTYLGEQVDRYNEDAKKGHNTELNKQFTLDAQTIADAVFASIEKKLGAWRQQAQSRSESAPIR